jgi:hypothetical protein
MTRFYLPCRRAVKVACRCHILDISALSKIALSATSRRSRAPPGEEFDRELLEAINNNGAQRDGCTIELNAFRVVKQFAVEQAKLAPGESSA